MIEVAVYGASMLGLTLLVLACNVFIVGRQEKHNLANLDSLLKRLGVAEGVINGDV